MSEEFAPVIWDIVEEGLDEAEFLSLRWSRAMASPAFTIFEVAEGPEERLMAQLDAVAIGGLETVDRLLVPALESEEPARVGAAVLALCRIPDAPVDGALELLQEAQAECAAAAARAFGLSGHPSAEKALAALLERDDPKVAVAAAGALVLRGAPPGSLLDRLLSNESPGVRAVALRAMRGADQWCRDQIRHALDSGAPEVRMAAVETGLVLGLQSAWRVAQALARSRGPAAGGALRLLAMSGEVVDAITIEEALARDELRPAAIWALGLLGTRRAAERCLEFLSSAELGGLAGEAFCGITGLEITQRIRAKKPPEEEEEEEEDEGPVGKDEGCEAHLAPSALEDLPRLAPEAVTEWWREARGRFDQNARYIQGVPLSFETLRQAFARASTRRRRAMALELAVRSCGTYRTETERWAVEQIALQNRPVEIAPKASLPFGALLQSPW